MRSHFKSVFGFCAVLALMLVGAQAETAYWSDHFEGNAGSRWTTNAVWQIGSPTTGPATNASGYRTYSGTNCATTGLKGGANSLKESRLICTNYNGSTYLLVPAASQYPRLRYAQWFNFVNSAGVVEVQVAGTTNWQAVSLTNSSGSSTAHSSGGVWSRPSFNMNAYAGLNVQVAFHFASGINMGTDVGWYVDDVELVTNQPVFNNPEGFEGDFSDWSVDAGTWQIGKPLGGPATNSAGFHTHSGTNCAATVLSGTYGWNMDTRLLSPFFVVPSSSNQALRFSQWYDFVNAGGYVEITTGNGSWTTILAPVASSGSTAVTSGGKWINSVINLSSYSGQTVQVAFHFVSGISGFGNAPGWYIDDLALVGIPTLKLPATITITNGQTFSATATATNSSVPSAKYTFALTSASTNATITTNGVINWINTQTAPGTYTLQVMAADDSSPALSVTNSFNVNVWPAYNFSFSNTLAANQSFLLILNSATNSNWRIDASTNLINWQPVLTNPIGAGGTLMFTDLLATNFPFRFYRAVYP